MRQLAYRVTLGPAGQAIAACAVSSGVWSFEPFVRQDDGLKRLVFVADKLAALYTESIGHVQFRSKPAS